MDVMFSKRCIHFFRSPEILHRVTLYNRMISCPMGKHVPIAPEWNSTGARSMSLFDGIYSFEVIRCASGKKLYRKVINRTSRVAHWDTPSVAPTVRFDSSREALKGLTKPRYQPKKCMLDGRATQEQSHLPIVPPPRPRTRAGKRTQDG